MSRKSCVFLVLFIASYISFGVMLSAANEEDWDRLTATMGLENPTVSKDKYTLEVQKFDGYGMVLIQVLKNNATLEEAVLDNSGTGWCYMDNKNLRLKAGAVTDRSNIPMFGSPCNPKAKIIFETKRNVEEAVTLELDLKANKDEYLLDEEVIVEMDIRNTGEVKANKVRLDVDSDGLQIRERGPKRVNLDKSSKKSCELKFRFPDKIKENYNVNVSANWEDHSGKHFIFETVDFKVTNPLEIYKSTGSEAFTEKPVYVTVSAKNIQTRDVKVRLLDLLPATFSPINDSIRERNQQNGNGNLNENGDLSWEFILAPKEHRSFSYCISSKEPGAHRSPQTHAYASLSGQAFTKSSDTENVITVYENITYKDYNGEKVTLPPPFPSDEIYMFFSGWDFSAYVNASGYTLEDIIIVSGDPTDFEDIPNLKDHYAFVLIPRGTELRDNYNNSLTVITIDEKEALYLESGLIPKGKCYEVGPQGTSFRPFALLGYHFIEKEPQSDTLNVYLYKDREWFYRRSKFSKINNNECIVFTPVYEPVTCAAVKSTSEVVMKVKVKDNKSAQEKQKQPAQ